MSNPDQNREKLYSLLGKLPDRERAVGVEVISTEEHEHYVLEKLVLDLNGIEEVPAYFAKPRNAGSEKLATILFNHSHGGRYEVGKDEFLSGAPYMYTPAYAEALTKRGYCALAIDAWNFGDRSGPTESALFKKMLWHGQVLWGMMVYDSIKAIDYLLTRPEVDASRLGTLGMSMGSTMAWWVAALDTRIKVCVDICCLTDFHALLEAGGADHHGIYYYVPSLLNHFDTAAINSLIAPRAHFSAVGRHDALTPPTGVDRIDKKLREVYAQHGAADKWELKRYSTGHRETAATRRDILKCLERWL